MPVFETFVVEASWYSSRSIGLCFLHLTISIRTYSHLPTTTPWMPSLI